MACVGLLPPLSYIKAIPGVLHDLCLELELSIKFADPGTHGGGSKKQQESVSMVQKGLACRAMSLWLAPLKMFLHGLMLEAFCAETHVYSQAALARVSALCFSLRLLTSKKLLESGMALSSPSKNSLRICYVACASPPWQNFDQSLQSIWL